MENITELGRTYELREITNFKVYNISPKIATAVCESPYSKREVAFYVKGSNCVTMDAAGNKFGARYNRNGKYYARSAKPV